MINNIIKFLATISFFLGGVALVVKSIYNKGKSDEAIETNSKTNKVKYGKLQSIQKAKDRISKLTDIKLLKLLQKKGK